MAGAIAGSGLSGFDEGEVARWMMSIDWSVECQKLKIHGSAPVLQTRSGNGAWTNWLRYSPHPAKVALSSAASATATVIYLVMLPKN